MLTVACLRSPAAHYYLEEVGEVAPLPGPLGGAARWVGGPTGALGLTGPVERSRLERLLEGRHPASGRPLRTGRQVGVFGYDLCFSAPKSVSVLFGTADLEVAGEVVSAHHQAVAGALAYVERRAAATRRAGVGGERRVLHVDGLLGAAFLHSESRAGDPHLHSHVVVASVVHGTDGRWSVADGRGLFAHKAAAGALYEAELRSGLSRRLGLAFERRAGGRLEVAGTDPALLGAFSGRRAEIAEDLWRHGAGSWRARHVAWAATRPDKGPPVDPLERRADWRRRGAAVGSLPGHEVTASLAATGTPGEASVDERHLATELAVLPAVPRRTVVRGWADSVVQGCAASDVDACVEQWWPSDDPGVTERRGAPSAVLPAPHLVALLGPRPVRPGAQPAWRRGAEEVERYGNRWGRDALGDLVEDPSHRTAVAPGRLADLLAARRRLDEARRELGRRPTVRPEVRRGLER